jgi:hypothetical protein
MIMDEQTYLEGTQKYMGTPVDLDTHAKMIASAKANNRTVAGELRQAIEKYLYLEAQNN